MQMELSQPKVDSLSAQVDVFSEESEFQAQIRPLMKSAPKPGLIQLQMIWNLRSKLETFCF